MGLDIKEQRSVGGLRANAVAFLVNLSTFAGVGLIFSLIVLILEPNNEFVRKYAKQTLSVNVIAIITLPLNIVVKVGTIIFLVIIGILLILQAIAAVYSLLGKEFDIPKIDVISDLLFVD
ncbi:hypothetical protein [Leptotrichia sp. oral taxon 847]|uniref:hypothetical protein n=1 Tax=Leptotrichia sp. oral taxon 847 TaxID=1785996 RepID=UPI0007681B54|nr:hypothetical protein [Leptotrichia sp. oral taxon 847]AMD94319.1 hypothetical protein AXF11_01060 [Leptotrichia sp. oral taxon 847]